MCKREALLYTFSMQIAAEGRRLCRAVGIGLNCVSWQADKNYLFISKLWMFDLNLWDSRCELSPAVHIVFLLYVLPAPGAIWFTRTATCFHPMLLLRPNQIRKWSLRGKSWSFLNIPETEVCHIFHWMSALPPGPSLALLSMICSRQDNETILP